LGIRVSSRCTSWRLENNCFTVLRSGSEEVACLRLVDLCITQLWAESNKEEEESLVFGVYPTVSLYFLVAFSAFSPGVELRVEFRFKGSGFRDASLMRNRPPLGPYGRTMPRTLWGP